MLSRRAGEVRLTSREVDLRDGLSLSADNLRQGEPELEVIVDSSFWRSPISRSIREVGDVVVGTHGGVGTPRQRRRGWLLQTLVTNRTASRQLLAKAPQARLQSP
jgi:hypothetical protein